MRTECIFVLLYGEENREHLYVAYYPMGFGQDVKLSAHGMESLLLSEYKEQYGRVTFSRWVSKVQKLWCTNILRL